MFWMFRLVLASILVAAFVGKTSAGDGNDWVVVQVSGRIWVQPDGANRVALDPTAVIGPGTTLATSGNGRVLLQRGEETMVVGPDTVMKVPQDSSRLFTTVIQWMGEIEFDVEKRHVRHFTVKTPYLAAVVKGTHFVVQAAEKGDAVAVERGVVEVRALRTGQKLDLRPGESASVSRDGHLVLGRGLDRADAGSGTIDTASTAPQDGGIGLGLGGSNGVSASVGGGSGVSVGLGGSNGVSASVGGGNGVNVGVGGSGGLGVSIGGGGGVNVNVGGIGLGLGGH